MLSSSLGRNGSHSALDDLQQGLLDAFPGYVTGYGYVLSLLCNLVDFVDEDDALFRLFNIVVCSFDKLKKNVLYVFTYISGFCKGCSISNGERNT